MCSEKFRKIHKKTPVPESATLFKKRPWHRCFPVNFVKFLRTPFLQNTSGQLLQFPADFVTFNEKVLNGKFHFLRSKSMYWFLYDNGLRLERVHSSACLRRQFPKYGRPITKSFLGTVLTIVFGARILSEII